MKKNILKIQAYFSQTLNLFNILRTSLLFFILFTSCGGQMDSGSEGDSVPVSDFWISETYSSDLRKAFRFLVTKDGITEVDTRVKKSKIDGSCKNGIIEEPIENTVEHTPNGVPVGAVFKPEVLLKLFKQRTDFDCQIQATALDDNDQTIKDTKIGEVNFTFQKDISFGITLSLNESKSQYWLTDLAFSKIIVKEFSEFEDPVVNLQGGPTLMIVCDNGGEDLLVKKGMQHYKYVLTENVTDIFAEEDFDVDALKNGKSAIESAVEYKLMARMEFKNWIAADEAHCVITNVKESTPYLLWSHLIHYVDI